MKKLNGKRIFIFIISVFLILNVVWLLITTTKYNKFVKDIPKLKGHSYAIKKEDGYNYHVKKPDYLHYTGNLSISNSKKGELLIIWPLISGGYKYGVRIQDNENAYEIYVNENMEPIDKSDTYAIQNIEKHKAGIEELFSKANKMWQLK